MRLPLLIFGLLASLALAASDAPIIRSIEVHSVGSVVVSQKKLLAAMGTRVGEPYSEQQIDEDIRHLQKIGIPVARVFGVPVADGVAVTVVVQRKSKTTENSETTELSKSAPAAPGAWSPERFQLGLSLFGEDDAHQALTIETLQPLLFSVGPAPIGKTKIHVSEPLSFPAGHQPPWPGLIDGPGPKYRELHGPVPGQPRESTPPSEARL